jgi:hypothetical protein
MAKTYCLSPSSLSLMKECPRCFWLHFHDKKRPEGIFPSLPNGMDNILKKHFDKFRDRGELPPELSGNKECIGCRLFDDKKLINIWRSNLEGVKWEDKNGNILRGAVDNILIKGNKLIVLDYKTRGFPLKDNTHEFYQNQLDLYNFLLRKNGYETEDYAFLLFYVPKEVLETGEVIFDAVLKKIEINVKNAEQIFEEALIILNGPCPSKDCGEGCEWCNLLAE